MSKANKTATMIGLDISSSSIKMVELSKGPKDKGYVLEQYAIEPLPRDAIINGHIENLFAVSEAIRAAWKRLGTQNASVRMALPAEMVITKKLSLLRGASEDGLESEVEIEANQYIPFELNEVYMDFTVMGPAPDNADEIEVLLAATRKENVDDRVAAVLGEGLQVIAVDLETRATQTSLAQICSQIPGDAVDQCIALVHIGSNVTTLTVVRNGELIYTRDQQIGGAQLTQQIQSKYGLPEEEAEAAKINGGLPVDYGRDVLSPFLDELVMAVSRALQFFYTCTVYNEVHHIVLIGRTALLPGLKEAVSSRAQVSSVSILTESPIAEMKQSSKVDIHHLRSDAPALMVACGLAMRGLDQSTGTINLLPHRVAPTATQIESGLANKDAIVRRRFARRTDFIPTPKQIERGLSDKDAVVRLYFAKRTDFTPTPKQIERGLSDASLLVRSEFVENETIRELLSYIGANSYSHLRVGLSPMSRASWGDEGNNLAPIPDSQTIEILMKVLLGRTEFEKFEKGSQKLFFVNFEESEFEIQLFRMNGQLGASVRQPQKEIAQQATEEATQQVTEEAHSPESEEVIPQATEAEHSPEGEAAEVDPIAEAELFLNFDRTEQAREILEEALRKGSASLCAKNAQELLNKMHTAEIPPNTEIKQLLNSVIYNEIATKIDLAQAYLEMGDRAGTLDLLNEIRTDVTSTYEEPAQSPKSETYLDLKIKLDLAVAYLEMNDAPGTIELLKESQGLMKQIQAESAKSHDVMKQNPILKQVWEDLEAKSDKASKTIEQAPEDKIIIQLLAFLVKERGSDLHLRAGLAPMMRVNGDVKRINLPAMENHDVQHVVRDLLGKSEFHKFESGMQSLFLVEIEVLAQFFKVQLTHANGLLAATIRQVPSRILTLDDLKAPEFLRNATEFPRGLILINGIVGSGWSTTMAAMRHEILVRDDCHVLTLGKGELTDHGSVKGVHTSILIGAGMDIETYDEALKCAENMDPDCIFITDRLDSLSSSEIRRVMELSRLGYLVFANVAALSTIDAMRQIIGALDYRDREFAQHQLASVLRVSICQRLLKTSDGGRVACHEHLCVYGDIRKAIESFDLDMLNAALENENESVAISMKRSAKRLLVQRVISKQEFDRV